MREVVVEIDTGTGWRRVGSQSEVEPPGSLSSDEPGGRQVYVFGWHGGDGPAVWRAEGGYDVSNEAVRGIATAGLAKVADLGGGPHEMQFRRRGRSAPLRFRAEASR